MRGFVYKIESDCKQILYIGSTTRKLKYRFRAHETNGHCVISKYLKDSNYSFSNGCELIKEYNISDRKHLLAYEQLWLNVYINRIINKLSAVNIMKKMLQKQNNKQYYEVNKEKIKEQKKQYDKQYHEVNKDKIAERRKQKVICECGLELTTQHLKRHQQTAKHQILLESKEQLIECLSFA